MHSQALRLLLLNAIGGAAVLGSYAWGIATHPGLSGEVWGGVPEGLKPAYTLSMLLAAVGYFPFTSYILFRLDPDRVRIGRCRYGLFTWLYLLVLVPSALWMPLTFAMLESPGSLLWIAIRAVLFAVGVGSVGIPIALLRATPAPSGTHRVLALVGCAAFCVQTALLDALVWPAFF